MPTRRVAQRRRLGGGALGPCRRHFGHFVKQRRRRLASPSGQRLVIGFVLVGICHLHMTPPRSDTGQAASGSSWPDCLSPLAKNRAALFTRLESLPAAWGSPWRKLCKSCAKLTGDRSENGPTTRISTPEANGAGLVHHGWYRCHGRLSWQWPLEPPRYSPRRTDFIGLVYLLVIMMWENLHKNWKV